MHALRPPTAQRTSPRTTLTVAGLPHGLHQAQGQLGGALLSRVLLVLVVLSAQQHSVAQRNLSISHL